MNILVTGGLGFIGSHTSVELLSTGHEVIVVDNLNNCDIDTKERIEKISGEKITFIELDIRDVTKLEKILKKHNIEAVMHFAALKAVGESNQKALEYYENNIIGLLSLLRAMKNSEITTLIFSSSCTVYGDPIQVPINEQTPLQPTTNPYGETKRVAERIIQDTGNSSSLKSVILRYFNPIGAHPSGELGELPNGTPNCIVPYITQCAAGIRPPLVVFGNNYPTPDGTGVRDYIHVVDLAKAHIKALEYVKNQKEQTSIFNVGTGKGTSVLELVTAFEKATGRKVPYSFGERRKGDVAEVFASADKANKKLQWKAEKSLEESLRDAWRWQETIGKKLVK